MDRTESGSILVSRSVNNQITNTIHARMDYFGVHCSVIHLPVTDPAFLNKGKQTSLIGLCERHRTNLGGTL